MISSGCLTYQFWKQKFIRCLTNSTKLRQPWHQELFCSSFLCFLGLASIPIPGEATLPYLTDFSLPWFLLSLIIHSIDAFPCLWCVWALIGTYIIWCLHAPAWITSEASHGSSIHFSNLWPPFSSFFSLLCSQAVVVATHLCLTNIAHDKALFSYLCSLTSTQNLHVSVWSTTHLTLLWYVLLTSTEVIHSFIFYRPLNDLVHWV